MSAFKTTMGGCLAAALVGIVLLFALAAIVGNSPAPRITTHCDYSAGNASSDVNCTTTDGNPTP